MADTDLIENEIMFTRLCERPSDELRRAGVKLETNTLAYSGLFYVSWVVSYQINTVFLALRGRKERNAVCLEKSIHSASCRVPAGGLNEDHL